jgi:polyisoprenoid-binding protein YceI
MKPNLSLISSRMLVAAGLLASASLCVAAPVGYTLDPDHTHPSFEVDHFNGLSVWRGTFKSSHGTATLDLAAGTGTVMVIIDTASIDFGMDALSKHVASAEMLDTAKYPTAIYQGTLGGFKNGAPTTVTGELTLHGVTKPVNLQIDSFKCVMHPIKKKEDCGADAKGTFNRADFGVNYAQNLGFRQDVDLRIQVEGIKDE